MKNLCKILTQSGENGPVLFCGMCYTEAIIRARKFQNRKGGIENEETQILIPVPGTGDADGASE